MNISNLSRDEILKRSEPIKDINSDEDEALQDLINFLKFLAKNMNDEEWSDFQKYNLDSDDDSHWSEDSSPKNLGNLEEILKKFR